MLWEKDPWFQKTQSQARDAEMKGHFHEAQRLYRSLYDEAAKRGEKPTIHEGRLMWIHSLIRDSRFDDAREEAERFGSELQGAYPRVQARLKVYLAGVAYHKTEYEKVLNISNRVLASPAVDEMPQIKTMAYNQLALAERHMGLYDKAIEHFQEALLLVRQNKLSDGGSYDSNLALIYKDQGRYPEALASFKAGLAKAQKAGRQETVVYAMMGIGSTLHALGRLKEGRVQFDEALARALAMEKPHLAQIIYTELGDLTREQGDFAAALDQIEEAIRLAQDDESREMEAEALTVRCWILHDRARQGDPEAALKDAQKALEIRTEFGLEYGIISALALKAAVLLSMGEKEDALRDISEAIKHCEVSGEAEVEKAEEVFFIAARVFYALGRREEAHEMAQRARKILQKRTESLSDADKAAFLARPINQRILAQ